MSLYNGYIRCLDNTDNEGIYTVGKIYSVKDGSFLNDAGNRIPTSCKLKSFEEWEKFSFSKWEELELMKCDDYKIGDSVVLKDDFCDGIKKIGKITYKSEYVDSHFLAIHYSYQIDHIRAVSPRWFMGKLVPKGSLIKTKSNFNVLMLGTKHIGNIGESTNLKDKFGNLLKVGDVVAYSRKYRDVSEIDISLDFCCKRQLRTVCYGN